MNEEIKEGYTRVSEFCSLYQDFSQVDPEFLNHRAEIGTNVHAAIRQHLCGVPPQLSEEEHPYFESWLLWFNKANLTVGHEETRLYDDKWMLTGAIDCIVTTASGVTMICDWKTSSKEHPILWPLRGCFYHHLVNLNKLCPISGQVLFVKLNKNGSRAKQFLYEITPDLQNDVFSTMRSYKIKKEVEEYERKAYGR